MTKPLELQVRTKNMSDWLSSPAAKTNPHLEKIWCYYEKLRDIAFPNE